MKILITTFCIFNIILAFVSFIPCLMAGAMSMDSPQAQNSTLAHIICYAMISFPIVCLVCGISANFVSGNFSLLLSFFPIFEAMLVILTLFLTQND